jgi:type I restriction enzyme M protein
MLHHLAPTGTMATILANGSLSSQQSGEGEIRKNLIEADLVECIVALPEKLFFTTGIPVCLWFLTKDKSSASVKSERVQRDRKGEILFIDARQMGEMVTRTVRELSEEDISRIAGTYNAWRGESEEGTYVDVPGFCATFGIEDIRKNDHVLTPGRYVGSAAIETDFEPLDEKIARLRALVQSGFDSRRSLQEAVERAMSSLKVSFDD